MNSIPFDLLSRAELRIAVLSARGCTNKDAASETFVSVNTVKTHVASSLRRLHANSRTHMVAILMLDRQFRDLFASDVPVLDLLPHHVIRRV